MQPGSGTPAATPSKVMGFDAAKAVTGWAVFDGTQWETGSLKCPVKKPKDSDKLDAGYVGDVLVWFAQAVDQLLSIHAPDFVAIESPLTQVAGGSTTTMTLHLSSAVTAETARLCRRRSIRCRYVFQDSWRSRFGVRAPRRADTNRAGFDRSRWNKAEARRICDFMKIPAASDDAAEAAGVAFWAWEQVNPRTRNLFDLRNEA